MAESEDQTGWLIWVEGCEAETAWMWDDTIGASITVVEFIIPTNNLPL